MRELREIADKVNREAQAVRSDVGSLRFDSERLMERVVLLERVVCDLCNTANKAAAIGPLMKVLKGGPEGSCSDSEGAGQDARECEGMGVGEDAGTSVSG